MVAAMRLLSALLGNEDLTAPLIDILKHIGLPTEAELRPRVHL